MVACCLLFVVCCLCVVGCWLIVVGCWLVVGGSGLLNVGDCLSLLLVGCFVVGRCVVVGC